jgi:protein SCO1/2
MNVGLATAALLSALLAGAAWAQTHGMPDSGLDQAAASQIVPRYLLMGPNGRAVMDSDFRGRFQLITFGYTFCPDICPTTLLEMAEVLKGLGDDAGRLQPIFVSVDPERDTPEQLKAYTAFFDTRILGLTGSPQLVRLIAEHFKVRYEKVPQPGTDQYAVDHSAGMFLLGPDGNFLVKFAYGAPVAEVVGRLRQFMAELPATRRR